MPRPWFLRPTAQGARQGSKASGGWCGVGGGQVQSMLVALSAGRGHLRGSWSRWAGSRAPTSAWLRGGLSWDRPSAGRSHLTESSWRRSTEIRSSLSPECRNLPCHCSYRQQASDDQYGGRPAGAVMTAKVRTDASWGLPTWSTNNQQPPGQANNYPQSTGRTFAREKYRPLRRGGRADALQFQRD